MKLLPELKKPVAFLKEVFDSYSNSKTPRLGAALSYYTIFAIAPLFVIAMSVAGFCFGAEAAQRELFGQVNTLVGKQGSEAIQAMVVAANKPKAGTIATIGAIFTLFAASTAVFVELQDALNTIWQVERKGGSGLRNFIKDRMLSFAMVLGIGFLLLVSLIFSAMLSGLSHFAGSSVSIEHSLWSALNFSVSLAVITCLFAMILKVLPDVSIQWRDVWVGAFVTALLFNFGKFLIGFYLGRSSTTSIYGAAGSFIILLLWVYYSAQILFFGAEFTRVYAGKRVKLPDAIRGARKVHQAKASAA